MKYLILVLIVVSGLAVAQDKPRVFVQGTGSQDVTTSGSATGGRHWATGRSRSTIDSHDESMEVTKDLQKDCSGVTVTLNQSNADYTVVLNRESKHNRGLLRTNSQIQVANRLGDILGTNATRTVGNASKDACQMILADWGQHGRTANPEPSASAPAAAPLAPAIAPPQVGGARLETASAVQPQPATVVAVAPTPAPTPAEETTLDSASGVQPQATGESLGDATKRIKQHKACLELAKDNPSIVCK